MEIELPEAVARPATAYAIQRELEMLSERYWRLRGFMAIEVNDLALARSSQTDLSFGLFQIKTLPPARSVSILDFMAEREM